MPFEIQLDPDARGFGGRRLVAKVDDGWIVGFNQGEWGGSLWWFDVAGGRNYKISDDQVIGFIYSDVGLIALEGLAHLGLNRGQLVLLLRGPDKRWSASKRIDLHHAPETALVEDDGSMVIATTDRLVRVHSDFSTEVLVDRAFWGGLYPNSIVRDSVGNYYLGMRHGVARIVHRKRSYAVEWLVPKSFPAQLAPRPN